MLQKIGSLVLHHIGKRTPNDHLMAALNILYHKWRTIMSYVFIGSSSTFKRINFLLAAYNSSEYRLHLIL